MSILGTKRPISDSYDLNLAILRLIRHGDPLDGAFFWYMSWEMRQKADLKHFRHQKTIFWCTRKSIWGQKSQFLRAMS